jgi:hypothetical protein
LRSLGARHRRLAGDGGGDDSAGRGAGPPDRPRRPPVRLFGERRARQVVRACDGAPAKDVVEALVSAVTTFAGGPLADDLCLVAVRPD